MNECFSDKIRTVHEANGNTNGGFSCDCNEGFADNTGCTDIDECSTSNENCDDENGFTCNCAAGLIGDG